MSVLSKIVEKYKFEETPFPFTRLYAFVAEKSPFARDLYNHVAREINDEIKPKKILDVGTGPGYLPIEIASVLLDVEIIGIDISKDMVKIASKNAEKYNLADRVKFKAEDAKKMTFEDSLFDFVVSTASLHHWREPLRVINECYRVLKSGKEAWIYDLRKDTPKGDVEELKKKYGYLMGSFACKVVRIHSSISLNEVYSILHDDEIKFKEYEVTEKYPGVLKINLYKRPVAFRI